MLPAQAAIYASGVPGLWQQRIRRPRGWAADLVVVLLVAAAGAVPYLGLPRHVADPPPHPPLPWGLVFVLAASAALFGRRRWPLPTWACTVVMGAAAIVVSDAVEPAVAIPIMVALYSLALNTGRKTWASAAAVSAGVVLGVSLAVLPDEWYRSLAVLVWVSLPPAVAEAVRNRRAYIHAMEERARGAEETKQEEARRQVAEERIRIARELHDVLAHTIAVINVQSGVAAHLIEQDSQQARQALTHINDASDAALSELRATLDVLRQDRELLTPTTPAPTLEQLDELVAGVRTSGLDVHTHTEGDLTRVPTELGVVAYRVLQEALTNVIKHAQAHRVEITVEVGVDGVTVTVVDDGIGAPEPPQYGHGRIGMRERVLAVGGALHDGPTRPGYRVRAALPLPSVTGGRPA